MKKLLCISLTACAILFTACGAAKSDAFYDADYSTNSSYGETVTTDNMAMEEYSPEAPMDGNQSQVFTQTKKIIKNAGIDLEALDVKECYEKLLDFAEAKGGYEFSKELSGTSDYARLNATMKVPPQALDEVLAYAEECGTVINVRTATDDITADYTDAEIRLNTKKKALERYYNLLGDAQNVDEIIQLQMTIDNLTAEIESYEGKLRMWNSQVNESTITIYIQQADDPDKIPEDVDWNSLSLAAMGRMMKNGFTSVVNGLVSCVQWLLIFIVTISPILILGAIITVIIVVNVKRKKKNAQKNNVQQDVNNNKE